MESGFFGSIDFDTDYMPKLSAFELEKDDGKEHKFVILEFATVMESNDPNIVIIPDESKDSDFIKNLIDQGVCTIVGSGTTTKSLGNLNYGLQHNTRVMYKHTIQEMFKSFTIDDGYVRNVCNSFIPQSVKGDESDDNS